MMRNVVQGLPSVALGALAGVFLSGGDYGVAWKGAVAGALAPVLHLLLKMLPVPYQGAAAAVVSKVFPPIALVLLLGGCSAAQVQTGIATAIRVADDVEALAQVMCLHEHAAPTNAKAFTVQDACKTEKQLAPYIEIVKQGAAVGLYRTAPCPEVKP